MLGGGKCGTTSLHRYLDLHPDVQMSHPKELRFFADRPEPGAGPPLRDPVERAAVARSRGSWERGIDWYRGMFDSGSPRRGESAPIYSNPWHRRSAERMAATIPDAQLVLVVRDPVERAISQYRFAQRNRRDPRPPETALAPDGYAAHCSRLSRALIRYQELFDQERVLTICAEELAEDTEATLRKVFVHAGVDPDFSAPGFTRRWNVTATQHGVRWKLIAAARRLPGWERVSALPPRRAIGLLDRATTARPLPGADGDEIPAFVRERLRAGLAEEAAAVRELTGMRLERWSL